MQAPAGIALRPFGDADLAALAALMARDEEYTLGRPSTLTLDDVRAWISGVALATDSWTAEEDGRAIAFAWLYRRGELGNGIGVVDPDARGRGLGSCLVDAVEQRARALGLTRLQYDVLAGDRDGPALLQSRGLREVRRFYEMAVELDGPPPEPVVPDGMAIEVVREEDAREYYATLDEAFRDHWEYHPPEFESWWQQKTSQPGYDPSLWFAVRDGDTFAAAIRNYANRNGGGWVDALGVRRAYRGRGLAKALLHQTFGEFHRRGTNRISLGVDAQNPTGATKLYESVGMRPQLEMITYEKALA